MNPVPNPATAQERLARMRLSAVVEALDRVTTPLLVNLTGVQAWDQVQAGLDGPFARCRGRIADVDVDRLIESSTRMGVRAVIPGDAEWPTGLDDLAVPPWCLWVRGQGRVDDATRHRMIAMVGARAATPYGTTTARTIAAELTEAGYIVVSGAAYGIDAAAHEGALAAGGFTIAALACGLDRAYPAAHRDLLERIRHEGVLISELPLGQPPMKHRFLARNRLIAAITAGTVVVEAGLRSGSLNTASYAVDLARPVGAVPGPVTSATSRGTHELIRTGAQLVSDTAEVIEMIGPIGENLTAERRGADTVLDLVSEVAARTRDAFPVSRSISVDQLVARAGLAVGEVLAGLGELSALGLAEQGEGGWRLCRNQSA